MKRSFTVLLASGLICASLSLVGRASEGDVPEEQLRDVAFLTNRVMQRKYDATVRYATEAGSLSGGICRVSMPSAPDRMPNFVDAVTLSVSATLESLAGAPVLFYVHGYNVGFERACEHAAQLARQTDFDGRLLLFSWPASEALITYHKDGRSLAESTPAILEALERLVAHYGAEKVRVVAHSMGSRIVPKTVDGGLRLPDGERVAKLVLIASDLERDDFIANLPALRERFREISVLVSDRDRLLLLSQTVNLAARLGQSDGIEIPGADIVDVTSVEDVGFNGHMYHLKSVEVGQVLRRLLRD